MQKADALSGTRLPAGGLADAPTDGTYDPNARVLGLTIGRWALLLTACMLASMAWRALVKGPTIFDDAYMFWRYALQIREGHGIAWNADGIQTYGLTSHLWLLVTLPFSYLPLHPGYALPIASTLATVAGFVLMGLAVSEYARSDVLRDRALAIAVVSLPLIANPFFRFHITTGMDTMLSLAANAAVVFAVLAYVAAPGMRRACLVGVVAFAAVLTRPENGICALMVPFLAFLRMRQLGRWRDLAGLAMLPVALIGLELAACYLVFDVPLPLSFFAKSLHVYAGFQNPENAVQNLLLVLAMGLAFVAVATAAGQRRDIEYLAVFLLPVVLTFAYLLTMRQIMGWIGRYYLPFLPYLIIPVMLVLDRRLASERFEPIMMKIAIWFVAFVGMAFVTWPLQRAVEAAYMRAIIAEPVLSPPLPTVSAERLPKRIWFDVIRQVSDEIVRPLPAGAVVAASEIGYLGAASPQVTLIDLVGLNDQTIGRRGFSMDYLLSRSPDLIWMPADDYTGLIAAIYGDSRLFERYVVVRNAFNYGIAIRRDSPHHAEIEASVRKSWATLYPDKKIEDFVVQKGPAPMLRSRS